MRFIPFVLVFLTSAAAAEAQQAGPGVESVTVTGTHERQMLQSFVQSSAAPARITGKLVRWDQGICPIVKGAPQAFAERIIARLKAVALSVGAPVSSDPKCAPNIQIAVTGKPQTLLDQVLKDKPDMLGYFDNEEQRIRAARMVRSIQAWYMTETVDLRGHRHPDNRRGGGLEIYFRRDMPPIIIPGATDENTTGSRLGDGLRTAFYQVLIVADADKLKDYAAGAPTDYIALLALSWTGGLDICRPLPSIVNLLAAGCEAQSDALTENDLAYLKGLYTMSADRNLRTQQDEIAYQMEKSLKGR